MGKTYSHCAQNFSEIVHEMLIKQIRQCAWREFLRMLRDPNLVLVLFVAPIAYTALYGSIYWNKAEVDVPVDIVDLDHSALSRRLWRDIDALQDVRIAHCGQDETISHDRLEHGIVHGIVLIPEGYEEDVKTGRQAVVHLTLSPGRLLVLSDIGIGISRTVATNGARVTGSVLARQGVPVFQNSAYAQPIGVTWTAMFNPWLTYGDMILPALLAVILIQLALIGTAAATAAEWGSGGWEEIFRRQGRRASVVVTGKTVMFVTVFVFFSALAGCTVVPLFDVHVGGNVALLFLLLLFAFAAAVLLGLFVGSYFRHRLTVFVVLGFSSYPLFMLSGYAWPGSQLAPWLRMLSRLFPTTPFLRGIGTLTQMGGGISQLLPQLLNLGVLILLFGAAAWWRYRGIAREAISADRHA